MQLLFCHASFLGLLEWLIPAQHGAYGNRSSCASRANINHHKGVVPHKDSCAKIRDFWPLHTHYSQHFFESKLSLIKYKCVTDLSNQSQRDLVFTFLCWLGAPMSCIYWEIIISFQYISLSSLVSFGLHFCYTTTLPLICLLLYQNAPRSLFKPSAKKMRKEDDLLTACFGNQHHYPQQNNSKS